MAKKPTTKSKNIQLSKGVYGAETDPDKTPFGFLNGQIRSDSVINNAGWFNRAGEKLGYGDLSMADMASIAADLIYTNDCFFVLSEFDTTWAIPKELDVSAPGKDYVLDRCVWVVYAGCIYKTYSTLKMPESATRDGCKYIKLSSAALSQELKFFNIPIQNFGANPVVVKRQTLQPTSSNVPTQNQQPAQQIAANNQASAPTATSVPTAPNNTVPSAQPAIPSPGNTTIPVVPAHPTPVAQPSLPFPLPVKKKKKKATITPIAPF